MKPPAQERVRELFIYNPDTGLFVRRRNVHKGRFKTGTPVGSPDANGYLTMWLDGKSYKTHRVAWLYMCGQWPSGEIDHINGNRADNRMQNLRIAARSEQNANCKIHSTNTTGHKGVYRHTRKPGYWAFIEWQHNRIWLGSHPTFEEAVAARRAAEEKYFGEFARQL